MSKLPRHPKDRGYGFLKACEYPKTQSGIASFTMNDLAELVTIVSAEDWLTKPKQNELRNTNKSR